MTALERLLAEELPTGTFGDARPAAPADPAPRPAPVTPAQAAANLAALEEALAPRRRPRLRLIHPTTDTPRNAA